MINILKLRKLEKENKQKKVQEDQAQIMDEALSESPEETTTPEKAPIKKKKVSHKKTKTIQPTVESEEVAETSEYTEIEDKQELNSVEPVLNNEADNPVEIFRQNLLNQLLNSDTLPEYSGEKPDEKAEVEKQENKHSQLENLKHVEKTNPESAKIEDINFEKNKKIHDAVVHIVSFSLGRENYGVDIMRIREIIRTVDVTKVPRAPEFIEGVINLRGSVIPVINLRTRIKLPRKENDKSTRIIVLELKDKVIGFIVDEVKEVLRIPENVIAPPPVLTVGKNVEYITAVAKLENSLIILIDPERLLSSAELDRMKN